MHIQVFIHIVLNVLIDSVHLFEKKLPILTKKLIQFIHLVGWKDLQKEQNHRNYTHEVSKHPFTFLQGKPL